MSQGGGLEQRASWEPLSGRIRAGASLRLWGYAGERKCLKSW